MQYNLRVFDYGERKQIRIYERAIVCGEKKAPISPTADNVKNSVEMLKKEKGIAFVSDDLFEQYKLKRSAFVSLNRTKQTLYEIARSNTWEWFITFTFNPKKIDSTDYDLVSKKVTMFMNNLKKRYAPDLKYILVPELHKDGKKFHFHGLFSNSGNIKFIDSGRVSQKGYSVLRNEFNAQYPTIYNIINWNYGFSTATKVQDTCKVVHYICKYITKDLCSVTRNKKRYYCSKNVLRPVVNNYLWYKDDIEEFVNSISDDVIFVKTQIVPVAHQKITYIEI